MSIATLAFTLLLLLQAPAAPQAPTSPAAGEVITLPIVAMTPSPIVEVKVNGKGPYRFMLDTGGQGQARADAALVKSLDLPQIGEVRSGDGSGRTTMMPVVRMASVDLAGLVFSNVEAPSRDYNAGRTQDRIDGVLGIGLFANHLLTIDYPGRVIRISRGSLPEPDGRAVLPYTSRRGIISLPIRIGDTTIAADIDSGSAAAIMLPAALAKTLPLVAPAVESGQARTVTSTVTVSTATLKGSAFVGQFELPGPLLEFSELFPHANVGSRLLREFALTVDQQNQRIKLERAVDGPVRLQPPPRRAGVVGKPAPDGMTVESTVAGSVAEAAGLRGGDIIIAIGGRPMRELFPDQIGPALTASARVVLQVRRGDETVTLTLVYSQN